MKTKDFILGFLFGVLTMVILQIIDSIIIRIALIINK